MTEQPTKSTKLYHRLKFMLKFILTPVITLVELGLLGQFIAQQMPGVNLQQWFHETRLIWFGVRIVLYICVLALVYKIEKKSKTALSQLTKLSIMTLLIFAEAVSNITLA
ncbi:hypothetical protein [Aggregatibacter actinomycetemcomitans]|uniref:hypothetical protein n=1 Tax=Aggregatibacter actinomycetemcomitans TaxID=714 RepID=UPI00197BD214|nr:hypothetical protein [Aggregatibacter actinomycetemcomitans]MBN6058677.1 hypothetical protein [Aggregatibacter actinomycetemcomitans]MBN6087186.1 hypothetical protein [Aggregatibacter actinomycetemcomitans]